MRIEEYVDTKKSIQNVLLEFLEDESDANDKYENFVKIVTTQHIINDQKELKELLYLISNIGDNHQHGKYFISKIERILRYFKTDIQNYFSNSEIFEIFKSNKRIILLLIEEKLITVDEYIFSILTNYDCLSMKYCEYFQPEIKPFLTKENIEKYGKQNSHLQDDEFIKMMMKEVEEDFYEKRREGENDDFLCQLIRFNKIKEFITFVEQTNISLDNIIKNSIFETNQVLIDNDSYVSLINYAAFFGSNDIIKYMIMKGAKLTSEMWIYAIHGRNAEMIRYLEENHISPPDNKYDQILEESIKCHHNDVSNYIIDYLMKEEDLQKNIEKQYYNNLYRYAVESRNYCFFPTNMKYKNMFFYLCEFDYYTLVKLFLEEGNININDRIKMLIF